MLNKGHFNSHFGCDVSHFGGVHESFKITKIND